MNRGDYIALMEDPSRIDRQSINDLEEMIGMFPYFQGAYMLLLKGLVVNEDVRFENKLHKYAFCVADREWLYYYLTQKKEIKEIVEQKTEEEVAEEKEDLLTIEKEENEVLAEESSSDLIDLDGEVEIKDYPSEFQSDVDMSGLDDLLVIEDYKDDDIFFSEQTDNDKSEKEYGKMSQGELIDRFIEANPKIPRRKINPASQQQNGIQPENENVGSVSETISRQQDINQSEEEGIGLVSETLAKIYVKQAYYAKAIDIYQKLSLNYPEKSSYFANQILKIKEIINS